MDKYPASYPMTQDDDRGMRQVHIRCPLRLWRRFRKRFPEHGDVTRVWVQAMREFLAEQEHSSGDTD